MFRSNTTLRSAQEVRAAREKFRTEIDQSRLPDSSKKFLNDQININLNLFENQLDRDATARFTADRVFEGDDYQVAIHVRYGNERLIDKLKRLVGLS